MFVMEVSYLEAAGSRECLARYLQRQNVRYGGDPEHQLTTVSDDMQRRWEDILLWSIVR